MNFIMYISTLDVNNCLIHIHSYVSMCNCCLYIYDYELHTKYISLDVQFQKSLYQSISLIKHDHQLINMLDLCSDD